MSSYESVKNQIGLYGIIGVVVLLCAFTILGVVLHKRRRHRTLVNRRIERTKSAMDSDEGIYDDASILREQRMNGKKVFVPDDLKFGRRVAQPKWFTSMPQAEVQLDWDDNEMAVAVPKPRRFDDGGYADTIGDPDYDSLFNLTQARPPEDDDCDYAEANRALSQSPEGYELGEDFMGTEGGLDCMFSPEGFEDDRPANIAAAKAVAKAGGSVPGRRDRRGVPNFKASTDFTSLPFNAKDLNVFVDDDYMVVRTEAAMQRYLDGTDEFDEELQMQAVIKEGFLDDEPEYLDHGALSTGEYLKSGEYLKARIGEDTESVPEPVEGEYLSRAEVMGDDADDDELYFNEALFSMDRNNTAAPAPVPRPRPPPPPTSRARPPPPPGGGSARLTTPQVSAQNDALTSRWLESLGTSKSAQPTKTQAGLSALAGAAKLSTPRVSAQNDALTARWLASLGPPAESERVQLPVSVADFMTMFNTEDDDSNSDGNDDDLMVALRSPDTDDDGLSRPQLLSPQMSNMTQWERPDSPESGLPVGAASVVSPPKWKSNISEGLGYLDSALGVQATPSTANPLWQLGEHEDSD